MLEGMADMGGATALERVRALATALAPGELLPAERALAAELGVARMTVRGAIAVLEREGLVRTRRGVGTERLAAPVRLRVRLRSFASAVREHGLRPETRVLSYARGTERPSEVSAHLQLDDNAETVHLREPVEGRVVPLAEVPDATFAEGVMGPGVAIEPTGDTVVAPADGTVAHVFPTGHAVAMELADGPELLVHVGMDTVRMEGKGFETLVTVGDVVTEGTPLLRFDLAAIRAAGLPTVTPVILLNGGDAELRLR